MINTKELYSKIDPIAEIIFEYRKNNRGRRWYLDYCTIEEDGIYVNMYDNDGNTETVLIPDEYYSMTIEAIEAREKDFLEKQKAKKAQREAEQNRKLQEEEEKRERELYEKLKNKFENQ